MPEIKEPLIPSIGVVTDIRIDTPDVKTFRVVDPGRQKAVRAHARSVRDALHPGRRRGDVLHHLFPDNSRSTWNSRSRSADA